MREIRTTNSLLQQSQNNIVWLRFPVKTRHNVKTMTEYLEAVMKFDDDKQGVLLCVDMTNLIGISRDARVMVSNEGMTAVHKAVAMIVRTPLANLVASFFLGINKPKFPIKSFTDSKKAMKWLQSYSEN